MNRFIQFFHHILAPHCVECQEINERNSVCPSCETLRQQLALANQNNEKLLERLLSPSNNESNRPPTEITMPKTISWAVRKQMLEREDRERARLMREAPKPTVESLEKELGISQEGA